MTLKFLLYSSVQKMGSREDLSSWNLFIGIILCGYGFVTIGMNSFDIGYHRRSYDWELR